MSNSCKITLLYPMGYGAIANENFRFFKIEIAEAITSTGQLAIKFISNRLNDFINEESGTLGVDYVVANDTDSVIGTSIIRTDKLILSIEKLFDEYKGEYIKKEKDNFVVKPKENIKVLTYNNDTRQAIYSDIKYIMKHRVKKRLCEIIVDDKSVIVTEDHSIMVKRNNKLINIKPIDVLSGDIFIALNDNDVIENDGFYIKDLGIQEEWVYDIEVEDTHTFFANDILVHNSAYITLNNWVTKNNYQDLSKNEIVDIIDNYCMNTIEPFIESCYNELAEYLNAMSNRLIMKREAIADAAIWRAKKNYIINLYDNEHVRYTEPKLKTQGIEVNRTSSPLIVRDKLTECLKLIIAKEEDKLRKTVSEFKKEYNSLSPNDIASPRGVKDIEKWLDDNGNIISGCPKHVRASIVYNNLVNSKEEYKLNHLVIQSGDKIKFIDLIDNNPTGDYVVGFVDELPEEFGLHRYIDRKSMFEGTFLSPLESFTSLVGYNIRHSKNLFSDNESKEKLDFNLTANEKVTNDVKPVFKKPKHKNSLF